MKAMVSFDEPKRYVLERQRMVHEDLKGRDITDRRVLEVMGELPRELFIKPEYADQAYAEKEKLMGRKIGR